MIRRVASAETRSSLPSAVTVARLSKGDQRSLGDVQVAAIVEGQQVRTP